MLHVKQESISKLEKRSDLMLSTLRSYIIAMGGNLKLVVEFPNRSPIVIKGFSELETMGSESGNPPSRRKTGGDEQGFIPA